MRCPTCGGENVDGANHLSNPQFEAITSFGLSRVLAFGTGSLGAIPLPSLPGGLSMTDMSVSSDDGYVMMRGTLE